MGVSEFHRQLAARIANSAAAVRIELVEIAPQPKIKTPGTLAFYAKTASIDAVFGGLFY